MTKEKFIEHWKCDIEGFFLEALCKDTRSMTNPELGMEVRKIQKRVEERLGQVYDQLAQSLKVDAPAKSDPPSNGVSKDSSHGISANINQGKGGMLNPQVRK